jgi:hypothetical protein
MEKQTEQASEVLLQQKQLRLQSWEWQYRYTEHLLYYSPTELIKLCR